MHMTLQKSTKLFKNSSMKIKQIEGNCYGFSQNKRLQ